MAMAGEDGVVQVFRGEWDAEGVYFYQAYNDAIADWALEHQRLGGPDFKPVRMTWIKPSLAWVLYRSGYARKHNQGRILKIKLPHDAIAAILEACQCRHGGGGSKGRVQWDPARDLMSADGKVPRRLLRERAIQIGMKDNVSELYVRSAISIEDATTLAHELQQAHAAQSWDAMVPLLKNLPEERGYIPHCQPDVLARLGMLHGETAQAVARIGRGMAIDM